MSFFRSIKQGTAAIFQRVLEIDQPIPDRSQEELDQEIEQNYRWNFTVNVLDTGSFFLSLSFFSSATIIPLFISKLTTSPIPIGIAAMLAASSWHLPQLFTANFTEKIPRQKPVVVKLGFFSERLPMWFMVAAAALAGSPTVALVLFLVSYAWHGFGAGLIAPAWQEMVARSFPVEKRGKYLGTGMFLGTITGIAGAAVSVRLLAILRFPNNFIVIFSLGALAVMLSLIFISLTREPVPSFRPPVRTQRQFLAGLTGILRERVNFRRFLIARLILSLGAMGSGFITLSALRTWGVSDDVVGGYTGVLLFGQAIGTLLLGFLADRKGHKLSLEIAAIVSSLAFMSVWIAPSELFYYPTFIMLGFANGGMIVSGILVVMEFAEPGRRPTFIGITNFGVGIVSLIGPLLGTAISYLGFSWLFGVSALLNIAAFIGLRFWVAEPRTAPAET
jgi:MFS family permease